MKKGTLEHINNRWRLTGHPHASETDEGYRVFCPQCLQHFETAPTTPSTLLAAMNEAIAHKGHCTGIS